MDGSNERRDSAKQLTYYCRDCEIAFDAGTDERGLEQAPCPECRQVCMTLEFEHEEHDRHRNEARFFSFLGKLTHLFNLHVESIPAEPERNEPLTIVTYLDQADAEHDAAELARHGINATLKANWQSSSNWTGMDSPPTIALQVMLGDVLTATKILRDLVASTSEKERPQNAEAVNFECEDCGKALTFPGHRRGGVETCPHCHNFVDVPE